MSFNNKQTGVSSSLQYGIGGPTLSDAAGVLTASGRMAGADATAPNDFVTLGQSTTIFNLRDPVDTVADSNITLPATGLAAGDAAWNGATLVDGSRVLLTGQTTPAENGAYIVTINAGLVELARPPAGSGENPGSEATGLTYFVNPDLGSTFGQTVWTCYTPGAVIGDPIQFTQNNGTGVLSVTNGTGTVPLVGGTASAPEVSGLTAGVGVTLSGGSGLEVIVSSQLVSVGGGQSVLADGNVAAGPNTLKTLTSTDGSVTLNPSADELDFSVNQVGQTFTVGADYGTGDLGNTVAIGTGLPANAEILRIVNVVTTAFDAPTDFSVAANSNTVFDTLDSDLETLDTYVRDTFNADWFSDPGARPLEFTLSASGATAGAGRVLVTYYITA